MSSLSGISGCGLGLRREFIRSLKPLDFQPSWFEIAPENWIYTPYQFRGLFDEIAEKTPLVAHGLSLSIGSPDPLNLKFLKEVKEFLDEYKIEHYSEHLSFSTFYGAQTYELLPVPMTVQMAGHIADKLKEASDFLGRPVIMENATYYYVPYAEMPEADFINLVLHKADTPLLLDVNNVYVNSANHGFDPKAFINELDLNRIAYIHTAGHKYFEEDKLIIDTHGMPIVKEVWQLLSYTLKKAPAPVVIERDNNIPPLEELIEEYQTLEKLALPLLKNNPKPHKPLPLLLEDEPALAPKSVPVS